MAKFLSKCTALTLAVSGGLHYDTCYKAPSDPAKPHILFVHGFPSSAYDWRHQVEYFADQGYGIIAPDTLGYGGSSKPTDISNYTAEAVGDSIIEVVQQVTKDDNAKVIGVGHDWGSTFLSRLANFHPEHFLAYAFVAVSYVPSGFFNVTALNEASTAKIGHPVLGYNNFFNESDSASIIDQHQESFVDLLYPKDLFNTWSEHMGPINATRQWLEADTRGPRAPYITDQEFATHRQIFQLDANGTGGAGGAGYAPALNCYRALISGLNVPAESHLTPTQKTTDLATLFIGVTKDPIAEVAFENTLVTGFSSKPTLRNITAGHWVQLEQPEMVNGMLVEFFEGIEGSTASE